MTYLPVHYLVELALPAITGIVSDKRYSLSPHVTQKCFIPVTPDLQRGRVLPLPLRQVQQTDGGADEIRPRHFSRRLRDRRSDARRLPRPADGRRQQVASLDEQSHSEPAERNFNVDVVRSGVDDVRPDGDAAVELRRLDGRHVRHVCAAFRRRNGDSVRPPVAISFHHLHLLCWGWPHTSGPSVIKLFLVTNLLIFVSECY